MNKCTKCGTEFEGNFCPKCGTASDAPKVCPKCNAVLNKDERFCSKCGYDLLGQSSQYAQQTKEQTNASWKNNEILRTVLKYAPFALFALWAVLLWAFFAAPIIKGDGFLIENVNLYNLLQIEEMSDLYPTACTMIVFAALSCAYAVVYAVAQLKKGNGIAKHLLNFASYLWHLVTIVCAIVFAVQYNEFTGGLEDANGSFVAVVISLTAVFALLQAAATVLGFKWGIQKFDEEEVATIKNKIARQREINRRLRKEKIKCTSATIATFILLPLLSFSLYVFIGYGERLLHFASPGLLLLISLLICGAIAITEGIMLLKKRWICGLILSCCQLALSIISVIMLAVAVAGVENPRSEVNILMIKIAYIGFALSSFLPFALQFATICATRKKIAKEYDAKFCGKLNYTAPKSIGDGQHNSKSLWDNQKLRTVLKYAPLTLFALWAVLLWAFFAAPIIEGDGFLIENVNLYNLLQIEEMSDMYPTACTMIVFAALSCAYAVAYAVVKLIKGDCKTTRVLSFVSYLWHLVTIICATVFSTMSELYYDLFDNVVYPTVLFAVLQGVAIALYRNIGTNATTEAETDTATNTTADDEITLNDGKEGTTDSQTVTAPDTNDDEMPQTDDKTA